MALTVAQLVARVTADTSGFYKSMAIMNSTLVRTGSVASRALAGIGLATTGIGILSLRAAGNFQQSMNILEAVSGGTQQQMAALRKEALALGKDFRLPNVSAKDAAEAMVELSKGGLSVNRTLTATRGALQLGLAANLGFTDSAQLMARSLQAFDLQGSQSARIANLFAAGANKSTAEITDLALGLQNAGAQFHGVGYSVEDLVTSLAILSDNALSGEYAGTALKTMLIRLTSPTKKSAEVMKKYGIEIFNAKGEMKELPNVIQQFQNGLGKLTQKQREQALTTIFGVRANQAMRILMGETAAKFREYEKSVTGTNAAVALANARTKGFNGAMGALGSAVETLAIELGTYLLPAAERFVRAMATFIASVNPETIVAIFRPFGQAVAWFKDLADRSLVLRAALIGVGAALGAFLVIGAITTLVSGLAAAFTALGVALLANPITLIAAALVGLGAALYYAYQRSETFRNVVNSAFEFLKDLIPTVQAFARTVVQYFQLIWDKVGPILISLVNAVRDRFLSMYNFVRDNMDRIVAYLKAAWTIISTWVETAVRNILSSIRLFAALLRGDWSEAWNQAKQIVSRTLSSMVTIVRAAVSLLYNAAILLGKAVLEGILFALSQLVARVRQVLSQIQSAISTVASNAYSWALSIGEAIVKGVLAGLVSLPGKLGGFLGGLVKKGIDIGRNAVGSTAAEYAARTIGADIPKGITQGMLLGFQDLPKKLSDKVREAIDAVRRTIQSQQATLESSWSRFTGDILRLFDAQTEQFKTRSEKLLAAFDLRQQIAENKRRIAELVQSVKDAQKELAEFLAAPPEPVTQREGESDAEFEARRLEVVKEWNDKRQSLEQAAEDARIALADEKNAQKLAKQRQHLVMTAEEERKQYNAARELQRRHLEDRLNAIINQLKQEPLQYKKYQDKVLSLLDSYGRGFRGAGLTLGRSFASGLLQAQEEVARAARALAGTVENFLATHSPAKEGPLSNLDHYWDSFASTLVSGLDTRPVSNAAASLAGLIGVPSPTGSTFPSAGLMGANTSPAGGITMYVTVEGSMIREQDLADDLLRIIHHEAARGRTIL